MTVFFLMLNCPLSLVYKLNVPNRSIPERMIQVALTKMTNNKNKPNEVAAGSSFRVLYHMSIPSGT